MTIEQAVRIFGGAWIFSFPILTGYVMVRFLTD